MFVGFAIPIGADLLLEGTKFSDALCVRSFDPLFLGLRQPSAPAQRAMPLRPVFAAVVEQALSSFETGAVRVVEGSV